MSKADTYETDLLKLVFQNIAMTLVGDAAGLQPSAAAGNLYVSVHTADPGEAGTQATNESAYTGYARVAVVRSAAGWTVAAGVCTNAALVTFPLDTAGTSTLTHFGIGTSSAGATKLLYSGALSASLIVNPGITPECAIGAISTSED